MATREQMIEIANEWGDMSPVDDFDAKDLFGDIAPLDMIIETYGNPEMGMVHMLSHFFSYLNGHAEDACIVIAQD